MAACLDLKLGGTTNGQNILTLIVDHYIELRRTDNLEKVWKETLAALNLSADVPYNYPKEIREIKPYENIKDSSTFCNIQLEAPFTPQRLRARRLRAHRRSFT